MCGINGFNFVDLQQMQMMNSAIKHRGPDDEGVFSDAGVSLGNVRLSVIDLSKAAKQPMTYTHNGRTAVIVYNGEVYNFADIRNQLEEKGFTFKTRTDTEVVLASYFEWGYECVTRFNGMWAFAIYDPANHVFFCSRDRLGKKPFYYYFDGDSFIFSSELKGILTHKSLSINRRRNINKEAVDLYFGLGFIPSPYTIYERVFKLEARQNLVLNLQTKQIQKWYYYQLPKYEPIDDYDRLVKQGREILRDAVRLRMIADVPIGVFLSGGLDSSTIVALMKDRVNMSALHTFSIGFEGKYDETSFIKIASERFATTHHHDYFTRAEFEQLMDAYVTIYDEPFADYAGFPTYKLSSNARRWVTVALSGDGGDEIFGGYPEYVMGCRLELIRRVPRIVRRLLSWGIPARRNLDSFASLFLLKRAFRVSLYSPSLFYSEALKGEVPLPDAYRKWTIEKLEASCQGGHKSMAEILRTYDLLFNTLPDYYLTKVDRASMAHGLEVRSPFLDYRLVEFSQKIPTKWKVDLFGTKKLFREIVRDILPDEITRRHKQGFVPPLQDWILDQKYERFLEDSVNTLADLSPLWYQFFREKGFRRKNRLYGLYKIRLFLFVKWMDRWIERSDARNDPRGRQSA